MVNLLPQFDATWFISQVAWTLIFMLAIFILNKILFKSIDKDNDLKRHSMDEIQKQISSLNTQSEQISKEIHEYCDAEQKIIQQRMIDMQTEHQKSILYTKNMIDEYIKHKRNKLKLN